MPDKSRQAIFKRGFILAAAGIAAIIAVNFGLSVVLSQSITERLLHGEGLVKQEFLNSILTAENSAGELFSPPAPSAALLSFSAHVRSLPGIVRANVYSPDGFIRHSTDPNLVGVNFSGNEELAEGFAGKISAVLETVDSSGKAEHLALNQLGGERLIEAYIPVKGPDGKVAAVVEFYQKDSVLKEMVSSLERSIWTAAALSSAILTLVLLIALRGFGGLPARSP